MDTIKFKEFIKYSRYGSLARKIAIPYFWICTKKTDLLFWLRKAGISNPLKYQYLKKWKNIHKGERCFVVATGPSLKIEDLDNIAKANIYSFGMNSCALALEKTIWVPDILGVQDEFVYKKIEDTIVRESKDKLKGKIWVSDNVSSVFNSAKQFNEFTLNYQDHKYDPKATKKIRFSRDLSYGVYDNYSIVFAILQLAVYMGFKEILLLGCDCNYELPKSNFIEHGAKEPNKHILGNRLIHLHHEFRKFAEANGVKVYNCTRGGMLEEYPRKNIDEVLGVI